MPPVSVSQILPLARRAGTGTGRAATIVRVLVVVQAPEPRLRSVALERLTQLDHVPACRARPPRRSGTGGSPCASPCSSERRRGLVRGSAGAVWFASFQAEKSRTSGSAAEQRKPLRYWFIDGSLRNWPFGRQLRLKAISGLTPVRLAAPIQVSVWAPGHAGACTSPTGSRAAECLTPRRAERRVGEHLGVLVAEADDGRVARRRGRRARRKRAGSEAEKTDHHPVHPRNFRKFRRRGGADWPVSGECAYGSAAQRDGARSAATRPARPGPPRRTLRERVQVPQRAPAARPPPPRPGPTAAPCRPMPSRYWHRQVGEARAARRRRRARAGCPRRGSYSLPNAVPSTELAAPPRRRSAPAPPTMPTSANARASTGRGSRAPAAAPCTASGSSHSPEPGGDPHERLRRDRARRVDAGRIVGQRRGGRRSRRCSAALRRGQAGDRQRGVARERAQRGAVGARGRAAAPRRRRRSTPQHRSP